MPADNTSDAESIILQVENGMAPFHNEALASQLEAAINELLQHDFARLAHLLYRVDVDENKLKATLRKRPATDAARVIADLLIQRCAEKVRSKKPPSGDVPDEDRW